MSKEKYILNEDFDVPGEEEMADHFDMTEDDFDNETLESHGWEYVASKDVYDKDGFRDSYMWYKNPKTGLHRFYFSSDVDYGDPEYYDWESESEESAQEWFDSYSLEDKEEDSNIGLDEDKKGEDMKESVGEKITQEKLRTPRGTFDIYKGSFEDFKNDPEYEGWGMWFEHFLPENADWKHMTDYYKIMSNGNDAIAVLYMHRDPKPIGESVEDKWVLFRFKSGSNPYIAKNRKEAERLLKKYGDKAEKISDRKYIIDDVVEDKFAVEEGISNNMTADNLSQISRNEARRKFNSGGHIYIANPGSRITYEFVKDDENPDFRTLIKNYFTNDDGSLQTLQFFSGESIKEDKVDKQEFTEAFSKEEIEVLKKNPGHSIGKGKYKAVYNDKYYTNDNKELEGSFILAVKAGKYGWDTIEFKDSKDMNDFIRRKFKEYDESLINRIKERRSIKEDTAKCEDPMLNESASLKDRKPHRVFIEGDRVKIVNSDGWTDSAKHFVGSTGTISDSGWQGKLQVFDILLDNPVKIGNHIFKSTNVFENNIEFLDRLNKMEKGALKESFSDCPKYYNKTLKLLDGKKVTPDNVENYARELSISKDKLYSILWSLMDDLYISGNEETGIYNIPKGTWNELPNRLKEDTVKTKSGKWTNKGKEGTHGTFKTKKEADAQRKAMFANKKRGAKWDESLEEDASTVNPGTADATFIANYLVDAINGEWDTIKLYNSIVEALKEANFTDIIPVIQDIVEEENVHVGQLQKALETISPDTTKIKSGEVEAQGQLEKGEEESIGEIENAVVESKQKVNEDYNSDDDISWYGEEITDDEYPTDSIDDEYPTDGSVNPFRRRNIQRRLVNIDREPVRKPTREDRENERKIRKSLENGSIDDDEIVDYVLEKTPDEMLDGVVKLGDKKDCPCEDDLPDGVDIELVDTPEEPVEEEKKLDESSVSVNVSVDDGKNKVDDTVYGSAEDDEVDIKGI